MAELVEPLVAPRKVVKLNDHLGGDSVIQNLIHGINKRVQSSGKKPNGWKKIALTNSRSNLLNNPGSLASSSTDAY